MTAPAVARNPHMALGRVSPLTDGAAYRGGDAQAVRFPFDGTVVAEVESSSGADVDRAVQSSHRAWPMWRDTPAWRRAEILERIAQGLESRAEQFVEALVFETGKTLADARSEVARSASTMRISAEEARRIEGATIPLDALKAGTGRFGLAIRVPFGVVAAISPFNAPLNLTIHKAGPALAAGNTMVVKPHLHGSAVTLMLAGLCIESGLPAGVLNVVTGGAAVGRALVTHPLVSVVNFTGSTAVGEEVARVAAPRKVLLELGGTGPTIIHGDADLDFALPLSCEGAFALSGQSCVSVQRLYVARPLYADALDRLVDLAGRKRTGNPFDPQTTLGPVIDEASARRIEGWINEAVEQGARRLCGGDRNGAMLGACVLTDVAPTMKVVAEEIFGPVICVLPYDSIDDAFRAANDSPFGLKAGIFTNDLRIVMRAMRELEFGTVNINGPSRTRTDHEPSGGAKRSGWAKEGPRYAIEEMTYLRMISMTPMP